MKKNLMKFAALALSAFSLATAVQAATGDVRALFGLPDGTYSSDPYYFRGEKGPALKAGQSFYVLLRLLNADWPAGPGAHRWSFAPNSSSASVLNLPKLGLSVGGRVAYAEYVQGGIPGHPEFDPEHPEFTDLYFCYTVQTGDLGLPVKVLTKEDGGKIQPDPARFSGFLLENANTGSEAYSWVPWKLTTDYVEPPATAGRLASLLYCAQSMSVQDPPYPGDADRTYDFVQEHVNVQAVDFDETNDPRVGDYPQAWRTVYAGMNADSAQTGVYMVNEPKVVGAGDGGETSSVYLWSDNEDVFVPVPVNYDPAKSYKDNGLISVNGKWVLPLTLPRGESQAAFRMRGGEAAPGATATIYMSPTTEAGQSAVGEPLAGATVTRTVTMVSKPPSTVSITFDDNGIDRTVTCLNDYEQYAAKMLVKVVPATDHPVTVGVKVTLEGAEVTEDDVLLGLSKSPLTSAYRDFETTVTVPANQTSVPLYVYTLGWKPETITPGFKIAAESTDAGVEVSDTACTLIVRKNETKVEESDPEDGATIQVKQGKENVFTIVLSDNYANLLHNADYKFTFTTENGLEYVSGTDFDFDSDIDGVFEMPVTFWPSDAGEEFEPPEGECTLTINAPNGKNRATMKFGLVTATQPQPYARVGELSQVEAAEGTKTVPITLGIDEKDKMTLSRYIFLKLKNPEDAAYVNTSVAPFSEGVQLKGKATEATLHPQIEVYDGDKRLDLEVVLSSKQGEIKEISGWGKGEFTVNVTNVLPKVTYVTAAGKPVGDGGTSEAVPKGVETTIAVGAWDVPADLDCAVEGKKFKTKVVVYDGTAATYEFEGNPEGYSFKHTFLNDTIGREGTLVHVYVKDKDTSAYPVIPNWTFRVPVNDTPRVTLAYGGAYDSGVWPETEANAHSVIVGLTVAAPVELQLRVTAPKAGDNGYLKFRTNSRVVQEGEGSYLVTLPAGQTSQELFVSEMDGTADTSGGIEVNAKVTTDTDSGYGKKWSEYYEPANPLMPRVQNVAPVPSIPMENAPTNENFAAFKPFKVSYKLASDVTADVAAGITVKLTVDGSDVETVTGLTDKDKHEFAANVEFTSPGTHSVTVTFYDKDDPDYGTARTVWYVVLPTKSMEIRAHGPADRMTTPNGHSRRYGAAKGLGAGRITAAQSPQSVKAWAYGFSASVTDASVPMTATGYSAGETDPAIDPDGNFPKSSEGAYYDYAAQTAAGRLGLDSFFYAWVCDNPKDSDGVEITAPAMVDPGKSGTYPIPLQDYDKDKIAYDMQYWEAVFSREYLASDNCGDINLDGIPDVYATFMGWKSAFSEAFDAATGTLKGNDLETISGLNGDEDYIPSVETSAYGALIPGLKETWVTLGTPFDAKMEIRGYGTGLNDAPAQAGISGVEPDRVYTDPAKDEKSTLSALEYLAWKDTGLTDVTQWSPERPTDPTTADTDEDGLPDGYEYYFWYRAHVGYMENGQHKYMTGRRYNPAHPCEPDVITPGEIEAAMDPLDPGDKATVNTRDTDNDGLPDVLEFEIGTNPFDFDTDHDGLPDGYEVIYHGVDTDGASGISVSPKADRTVLDPLLTVTVNGVRDSLKNPDGDAMAYEYVESKYEVYGLLTDEGEVVYRAVDLHAQGAEGYLPVTVSLTTNDEVRTGWRLTTVTETAKGPVTNDYFTTVDLSGKWREERDFLGNVTYVLCTELLKTEAWELRGKGKDLLGKPVYFTRGAAFAMEPRTGVEVKTEKLAIIRDDGSEVGDDWFQIKEGVPPNRFYAAFVYGERSFTTAEKPEFGMFAICGDAPVKGSWPIVYVHSKAVDKGPVYLIHHISYAASGFDPRAAWDASKEKSRAFTTYDEFLALAFHLHVNTRESDAGLLANSLNGFLPSRTRGWTWIWQELCTDPFSADTDEDGKPDGWELYVMAGPRTKLPKPDDKIPVYAAPHPTVKGGPLSVLESDADDGDGLDFLQEYMGMESGEFYSRKDEAPYTQTIEAQFLRWKKLGWRNKKWPTDPWNGDTDGDGISDGEEGKSFIYGDPEADGAAGGGLNPLSWDTDLDGLPDPFELEFQGVYTAGASQTEHTTTIGADGTTNSTTRTIREGGSWSGGMDGTVNDANLDYDHDGLLNWQEYMVGSMRSWRYDDTFSSWSLQHFDEMEISPMNLDQEADPEGFGRYWYERTVCIPNRDPLTGEPYEGGQGVITENPATGSYEYNPRLVNSIFDAGSAYFSLCTNAWDSACGDWYMFRDGVYHDLKNPGPEWAIFDNDGKVVVQYNRYTWWVSQRESMPPFPFMYWQIGDPKAQYIYPERYICCDPTKPDTDNDGMDDYYELFHGMNPLLGLPNNYDNGHRPAVDVVYEAYGGGTIVMEDTGDPAAIWSANNNFWLNAANPQNNSDTGAELVRTPVDVGGKADKGEREGLVYDFVAYPWMAGAADADPDGDNIRNQEEAIMPGLQSHSSWHHTDPTPLWMTDLSYAKSLTYRYYRPVSALGWQGISGGPYFDFDWNGDGAIDLKTERWDIRSFPGYDWDEKKGIIIVPYTLHRAFGPSGTIYSFEENEGFDSDHDYLSDFEEAQGKTKQASDPQLSDDPLRRQAMWFDGVGAFLETPLAESEYSPVDWLPIPPELPFLYFTAECWVRPDDACDLNRTQTILERAIWNGQSNPGDMKYLRKNFLLGIRNGRWYAKFDSSGTDANQPVEITEGPVAERKWTHLAATYDGTALRLYVDGICAVTHDSSVAPEHGTWTVTTDELGNLRDGIERHSCAALLVGASAASKKGVIFDYGYRIDPMDPTTRDDYQDFYHGYVDEVRIWDGARNETQVLADYRKRYTQADCADNRQTCLNAWLQNASFDASAGIRRPAELRYHFSFDHLPGASDSRWVLKAPAGFLTDESIADAKAKHWSRPDDWACPWWNSTHSSIKPTVYSDFAWLPWIGNTVSHLPRPDGTTLDSFYWSADYAGDSAAVSNGYEKFDFPMTAEYVSKWRQMAYVTQNQPPNTTPTRYELVNGLNDGGVALRLYSFTLRHRTRVGEDLLPFGGAFAKRISLLEGGMWDEKGPADAWAESGEDADNNALPDWWETYCRKHYLGKDFPRWEEIKWDTTVTYAGALMPAWQAYLRDLAKGMLPDQKYHPEYADATGLDENGNPIWRDMDNDGLPDWWEEMYNVQGFSKADADADPDRDGLSNYAEYMLSEVYPNAYPAITNAVGNVVLLNPRQAHTQINQLVTDYFLRYSDEPIDVTDAAGESHFRLNEYFGEIATDHDFMEDWWESQFDNSYVSPRKYDPLDDKDEDGWSNFAECRSWFWCGGDQMDMVSRWITADKTLDFRTANYPKPAISLNLTYHGQFKDSDLSAPLVVRTQTLPDRTDATFVVSPNTVPDAQAANGALETKYVGTVHDELPIHGFLSPGNVDANSVFLQRALCGKSLAYEWGWDWYDERNRDHPDTTSGDFTTFLRYVMQYPYITIEKAELSWTTVAVSTSDKEQRVAQMASLRDGRQMGSVDVRSGEYELDIASFFETDGSDSANEISLFRLQYASRMPYGFPKTVTVQDTRENMSGGDRDLSSEGYGRVRAGRNTIEVFVDRNGNGTPDPGEPFGSVRNVEIGWHKVPTVAVELRDTPPTMPCVVLAVAEAKDAGGDVSTVEAEALTKTVRVTRRLVNGMNVNEGKRLTERQLLTKDIVVADHPYLTEADVLNVAKPDLDWTWLMRDARKFGVENVDTVTYSVDEVQKLADGSTTNMVLKTFVKRFSSARSVATALSPVENEPVYSASPKLVFSASDDNATGYRLQIRKRGGTAVLYDSGYRVLPGRTGSAVGKPAYEVTPPVFADMDVVAGVATSRQVFADGSNYQWRVALVNAKFNAVEEADYCGWAEFQMDVRNRNRYPKQPTGYGNVSVAVRYYGPTNCAPADVIVEAFANADFSGQPLAQVRLGGTRELLRSTDNVSSNNAVLRGIDPGKAFFRAYFDQNGNGIRDRWETWGYANMVGTSFRALYNPLNYSVEAATAEGQVREDRSDVVIYMEDCDVNKNEWPDCIDPLGDFTADTPYWIEPEPGSGLADDPLEDTDGDGMPDVWENWNNGVTDPFDADGDYVPEDQIDVMAYREETRYLVTIDDGSEEGLTLLFADGEYEKYKSQDGKKAAAYTYTTYYPYGPAVENAQVYGVGTNVTISAAGWWIKGEPVPVTVALVHAQVYAKQGYDMLTANPEAYAAGKAVDTKPFTALDRYLVMRYFEAIGATPKDYPSKYKSFEEYALNAGSEVWKNWSLLPGRSDSNYDTIDDGWQLYVMYGDRLRTVGASPTATGAGQGATSPWGAIGATTAAAPDGNGLTWRQEYDRGHYPTDPWNAYTIGDYFYINGVRYDVSDKDAYAYHLKHFDGEEGDKYADFDNDGLTNYDEYDIMKNNNRTLAADNMFSYFGSVTVPALAGQCVPDYFLKSTKRNPKITDAAVYDYLGFDYTSHDFIESWWKDGYTALLPNSQEKYVDRTRFEPYEDPDGDGWSNWSEARAGTDPSRTVKLSIENATIAEYPIPLVTVQLPYAAGTTTSNAQIVICATRSVMGSSSYDAVWRMNAGNASGGAGTDNANERIIGSWQNTRKTLVLSPSSVKPGSVFIYAKDLGFTYYDSEWSDDLYYDDLYSQYYGLNTGARWSPGDPTEAKWVNVVHDVMHSGDGLVGDLVFSDNSGVTHVVGQVNYETGVVEIDFAGITGTKTQIEKILETSASTTESGNMTSTILAADSYYHYTRMSLENSYYKIVYSSQYVAQDGNQRFYLSEASEGHLREGLNDFVAFADLDGNGAYDPGEPFGCAKGVQVGWDRVVDLSINLATTSPVIPRFDPMNIGEGISTNGAGTIEYRGKPVITDLAGVGTVRIVRWELNGAECTHRTVFRKTAENLGVITEADVLSDYNFDLDWTYLERDAAKAGIGLEDIRTVTYAVIVDVGALSPVEEDYVTGWIVKDFSDVRATATPVAPSKGKSTVVTATRPTFEFTAPSGYPAFAFELCDKDGNVVFSSTEHISAKNAAGNVTYRPPVFFGWDEEADKPNRLLPNGEYTWRVALLNAKYRTAPRGEGAAGTVWSDAAKFTVELAKGKVEDTDKGALDVVVRYYGDAKVDAEHPIIVQAFRTADFTGVPEGQTAITNTDLLASYDNITNVNAKIYGLAAGDYYICAFVDTTNDVKRMRWESWGYVNKVLSEDAVAGGSDSTVDLYTPVATKVMRNDTSAAVLFIEDADCNNDRIPDWMDLTDVLWDWPWPEPPPYEEPPVPVPPEEPLDPNDPGGPIPSWFPEVETDPNDVMAYEDLEHVLLVKVGLSDADTAARWYAVMDLANEGWKLRDSDIALQTPADEIGSLVSTWEMGRFTGIGTNVTVRSGAKVLDKKFATVRLIHAQVYAKNGYETGCAAVCPNAGNDPRLVDGIAAAEHPHTKPCTRADKYYFCRYLENIGVEGVSETNMIAEIEKAKKGVAPADYETVARPIWSKYTLDPDEIDMDRDDIADGWEAYVMFGTVGLRAFTEGKGIGALADLKISPFNTADGMLPAPGAGSQLKLVEEFDGGYYPTDPWQSDTDHDGVIDFYAYQYHLKGGDAGKDFDLDENGEWTGDGLSNYAEYLISEVFRYAKLDPEKKMTDGACVDYFRKMGDLYVGEIFTDHDQVDDVWESEYAGFANRDLYDPNRDDDHDGWSNYAEFRAGTDPTTGDAYGVDEYTRAEYPVPVIEAKVVYNGKNVNLGSIVFKAWNDADDPDMTSAPDAIWTIGNGKASEQKTDETGKSGSTLQDYEKYAGRKPSGVQRYALGGGTLAGGTVEISFLNKQFTDVSYPTNGTKKVSAKPTEKPGDPKNAKWYLAARDDGNGHVVTLTGERIGTVDYAHGILTVDFGNAAVCGPTTGDRTTGYAYATEVTATEGNVGYDAFSFDDAHVLVSWQAKYVGLTADGTYTLGDADPVTETAKSHGHVREGLNTFYCFADADGDGNYTVGEPFGVVRGVDVGWQGAKFTVELTDVSPLFARIDLYTGGGETDRSVAWNGDCGDIRGATLTNFWQDAVWTDTANEYDYVRIVPYAVSGTKTDGAYYERDRECVQLVDLVPNRVVAEFAISAATKPFISEADFLRDGEFDIDWNGFASEIANNGKVRDAVGDVTAVKYRIVFGREGPVGYEINGPSPISPVRAYSTLVERRFDASWAAPRCEGVIGGGDVTDAGVIHTAHPTFVWSMPVENESEHARAFGCSYTAFKIRITEGTDLIYDSGVVRAPAQDEKGRFVWTAPISVGDQTPQGKIFRNSASFRWNVVMYNAKFKPGAEDEKCWAGGSFSTSVNTQQPQNDATFSSIGVTVKYTGPVTVLGKCGDLSTTKGTVRVQAFETADFSGVPASETFVASKVALTDVTDVLTNACLSGLAAGTYYIRAYIDMNGNFQKDDFESWGYAKEPVTVGPDVIRLPAVSLYIEDADTNGNWYPDAWEYAYKDIGNWSHDWEDISGVNTVKPNPDGKITIARAFYDQMVGGTAGISTGLSGAKITIFQDGAILKDKMIAKLLLYPYVTGGNDDVETTFDAIRKAVEKKVVDKTLKITAITLDTAKSQVILAMDAETDYANLVAGNFATRLYDLTAMGIDSTCTVTVQVYKKSTLAQASWELVDTVKDVKIGRGEVEVSVDVKDNGADIDPTSGFYMIKVVQ